MPRRKKPYPICSAEDCEKVARMGFGITDEDIAAMQADEEFQESMRRAREQSAIAREEQEARRKRTEEMLAARRAAVEQTIIDQMKATAEHEADK